MGCVDVDVAAGVSVAGRISTKEVIAARTRTQIRTTAKYDKGNRRLGMNMGLSEDECRNSTAGRQSLCVVAKIWGENVHHFE